MKKLFFFALIFTGLILLPGFVQQDDFAEMVNNELSHSANIIRVEDLVELQEKNTRVLLLDARSYSEYKVSHIKGALWIGENSDEMLLPEHLLKNKKINVSTENTLIVVYCSIGYRSEKACERLKQEGHEKVFNLWGGIFDWLNKGYPVVDMKNEITPEIHPYNEKWGRWLKRGVKKYE